MAELIVLDDFDDDVQFGMWPVCKRQRFSREEKPASHLGFLVVGEHVSQAAVPDTSNDAALAEILQAEEDNQIAARESVVALTGPTDSFGVDPGPTHDVGHAEVAGVEAARFPICDSGSEKQVRRGSLAKGRQASGVLKSLSVKLVWDDGPSIVLKLRPDIMLATIFSKASVKKRLRASSDRIQLHRGLPDPTVFDFALAGRTSVIDALGRAGGVLRVRQEGAPNPGDAGNPSQPPHRVKKSNAKKSQVSQMSSGAERAGECDSVEIVRLRKPGDDFGSPIALVKNFNRDRGALLARLTGLREMVEMAPEARAALTQNVRNELDSYAKGRSATGEVQRASDRVLDIVEDAVREDLPAHSALRHRTDYASTAVLVYEKGQTLPRHVDNCGHWVVLFSFGRTVDFHAGGRSVKFESGDVLVFNGSKRDAVMHGIDKMHPGTTLGGKARKLPAELDYLERCRVSFQARQGDAL